MYSSKIYILKALVSLHYMCSLPRLYVKNEKHVNLEVVIKSNDFLKEKTQSLSLRCTKPKVVP